MHYKCSLFNSKWKTFYLDHLTISEDRGILVLTLIFLFWRVWGWSEASAASSKSPTSRERISGSILWRAGVKGRGIFMSCVGKDVDIFGERRQKFEIRRKLEIKWLIMSDYGLNFLCFFLLCSRRHVLPDGSRQRMTVLLCDCDSSTLFMKWCGRFSLLLHNFLWFWWTWNCTERRWDGNFRHTVVVTLQAERVTRGVMVSRTVSHVSRDPTQSNICPNFHHCSPPRFV